MRCGALFGASLIAGALATAFVRPAAAEIVVRIDKETQTMTVTVDRQVLYVWPVSTGMIGRDTPSGTFHPNRMDADHHSQEWDGAPMPHTIFFDMHGHATHGFASITHLGNPASHGCVRLAPANAAILFDLVKMEKMANTTVIITGTTPTQQAMAKLGLPVLAAANAPLTREALTHRSSDQAQPYDNAAADHIKEAAVLQPPQTLALQDLIPTPTFAMPGAKWQRRLAAMQLAALAAMKPPPEPVPLSHAADRQAHEPAMSGPRQAASALVTALNEQPQHASFEQLEPVPQPVATEQPQPHAADAQPHRPVNNVRHADFEPRDRGRRAAGRERTAGSDGAGNEGSGNGRSGNEGRGNGRSGNEPGGSAGGQRTAGFRLPSPALRAAARRPAVGATARVLLPATARAAGIRAAVLFPPGRHLRAAILLRDAADLRTASLLLCATAGLRAARLCPAGLPADPVLPAERSVLSDQVGA